MLNKGDTIALVACSNGKSKEQDQQIKALLSLLKSKYQLTVELSEYIFQKDANGFNGSPKDKAASLMNMYLNPKVSAIFDISGGNLANELLPYLDFDQIQKNPKPFIGYSDLTVLLNGIYHQSGNTGVYYQIMNLVGIEGKQQQAYFETWFFDSPKEHHLSIQSLQLRNETKKHVTLIGGNIRCFLKLAGTAYFPNVHQKILFIEANGGNLSTIATYFAQLDQLGCFKDCGGILIGQFTQIDQDNQRNELKKLLFRYTNPYKKSIYETNEIGHSVDAQALIIGGEIFLREEELIFHLPN